MTARAPVPGVERLAELLAEQEHWNALDKRHRQRWHREVATALRALGRVREAIERWNDRAVHLQMSVEAMEGKAVHCEERAETLRECADEVAAILDGKETNT